MAATNELKFKNDLCCRRTVVSTLCMSVFKGRAKTNSAMGAKYDLQMRNTQIPFGITCRD